MGNSQRVQVLLAISVLYSTLMKLYQWRIYKACLIVVAELISTKIAKVHGLKIPTMAWEIMRCSFRVLDNTSGSVEEIWVEEALDEGINKSFTWTKLLIFELVILLSKLDFKRVKVRGGE